MAKTKRTKPSGPKIVLAAVRPLNRKRLKLPNASSAVKVQRNSPLAKLLGLKKGDAVTISLNIEDAKLRTSRIIRSNPKSAAAVTAVEQRPLKLNTLELLEQPSGIVGPGGKRSRSRGVSDPVGKRRSTRRGK